MSKFKVGDKITINDYLGQYIISVENIESYNLYVLKYIEVTREGFAYLKDRIIKMDIDVVDSQCSLYVESKPVVQENKCTCDMRVIMMKGCQCGSVTPYKMKWS